MPIKIPDKLPAQAILEAENIFIMSEERAVTQDIRPLRILLLNLMPTKVETETQILRILGNTPLQVEVQLLQTATHVAKNISAAHLTSFYYTLDQVRDQKFDGMIVTGAPVELMEFEEVDYWRELCEILNGRAPTFTPLSLFVGELRLPYTIFTVFKSICCLKSWSAFFLITRPTFTTPLCADWTTFF